MGISGRKGAGTLRLVDLTQQRKEQSGFELLSVRLPVALLRRVDALAEKIGSGKREVVLALLNEGLERYDRESSPRSR